MKTTMENIVNLNSVSSTYILLLAFLSSPGINYTLLTAHVSPCKQRQVCIDITPPNFHPQNCLDALISSFL